jgi:adenylate cyclase
MAFSYVKQPRSMRILDHKLYDAFLHVYHDTEISPGPVIIDLDEGTLAKYGQWPWPRFLLAELVQGIVRQGAAAVGVDKQWQSLMARKATAPRVPCAM